MQIVVDGRIVGYDRAGKGKTVVMLHGWGADRSSLSGLSASLSGTYDVVRLDVPGFGASERPTDTWGLDEYATWLRTTLEKLKIKQLYALIGHSNGGAIAIKAVSGGLACKKLVLLGASGVRNREKGKQAFLTSIAKTGKIASRVLPASAQDRLRKRWYKRIGSELYDTPGMEAIFKKVVSEDLLVDAGMISVPTLLLYGSEDRATPPVYGQMYHRVIEGSEFHMIEGAGHYSFIDCPEEVSGAVRKFLG